MKKSIALAILALLATWVYQYIAAGIRYSRLDGAVIADLESAPTSSPDQLRDLIVRDARAIGVPLEPESVVVTVEETNEKGLAGQMLSGAGMRVQSRVAKVRLSYRESILGLTREFTMERQHTYTAKAAPPPPAAEPEPPSAP